MLSSMPFKESRTIGYNLPPTDAKTSRKNPNYDSIAGSPYKLSTATPDQHPGKFSSLRFRSPLR